MWKVFCFSFVDIFKEDIFYGGDLIEGCWNILVWGREWEENEMKNYGGCDSFLIDILIDDLIS